MKKIREISATVLLVVIGLTLFFSAMGASFGAGIKTIQQGTGTQAVTVGSVATVNVTITAVTLAKAEVKAWATQVKGLGVYGVTQIAPVLTSTTNLRLFIDPAGVTGTATFTWQVIEYF